MSEPSTAAPFFSVVIPTYNRAKYIAQAVESVLGQDFQDFELLVVDDGSEDATQSELAKLSDPRLKNIVQENQGRSRARNNGIQASNGAFVCFLDSDDFWETDHLAKLQQLIQSHDSKDGLYHGGLFWYYPEENRDERVKYVSRDQFTSDVEYVIHNQFAPDTVAISRSAIDQFQFDPDLFLNEDLELWARIAAHFPVFGHDEPTAHLRVHEGNTSNLVEDHVTPQVEVFQLQLGQPGVKDKLSKEFVNTRMRTFRTWHIRLWKEQGKRGKLISSILQYAFHHPTDPSTPSLIMDLLYALPLIGGLLRLRKKI